MAVWPPIPPELAGFGDLIVAMRPDLMGTAETFRDNVSAFANAVRSGPVAGGPPVRMPFDRSREERARRLSEDAIEIPDVSSISWNVCRNDQRSNSTPRSFAGLVWDICTMSVSAIPRAMRAR
jgi:LDH2 family malate/lactate/ureidoglycolate dehydrogenase